FQLSKSDVGIGWSIARGIGRCQRGCGMKIVEKKVSAGEHEIFDLDEFLSRPLYAHLAHNSDEGPRESPVWFHWDGQALWIIGGTTFPENLKRDPRCAIGIVDWDPATGLSHHVGFRGKAEAFRSTARWPRRFSEGISAPMRLIGTGASTTCSPGNT